MVQVTDFAELQAKAQRAVGSGDVRTLEATVLELESLPPASDPAIIADIYRFRGILSSMQYNHEGAITAYQQALDILEPLADQSAIARITNNMGVAYHTKADYPNAIYWYRRSLQAREAEGNLSAVTKVAGNIGMVYSALGDVDRARGYYERSLEISKQLNDKEGVARGNAIVGNMFLQLNQMDQALPHLLDAIIDSRKLGMDREWLTAASSLSAVYYQTGDLTRALALIEDAEPVAEAIGLRRELIMLRIAKARIHYRLTNETQYLDALTDLLEEVRLLSLANEEQDIHELLYELYKDRGDLGQALHHHEQWVDVRERIAGEDRQRQMVLLETEQRLQDERRKTEEHKRLLFNMLPTKIAQRLLGGEREIADSYPCSVVLFSDLAGFTQRASNMPAESLIALLNGLFSKFDIITRQHGLTKIKTIGDAYMAIAGAPEPMEEWPAAVAAASAAVEMMEAAENLPMRLGLHTGGVVAGVIGSERMVWDVWGDTVNVASRMENSSVPGRIQVSADFAMLLANGAPPQLEGTDIMIHPPNFLLRMRGTIDVKGKGEMKTFWLERAAKP